LKPVKKPVAVKLPEPKPLKPVKKPVAVKLPAPKLIKLVKKEEKKENSRPECKRRLITLQAAREGECWHKQGVFACPQPRNRIGGSPRYPKVTDKVKAKKIDDCLHLMRAPKVMRIKKTMPVKKLPKTSAFKVKAKKVKVAKKTHAAFPPKDQMKKVATGGKKPILKVALKKSSPSKVQHKIVATGGKKPILKVALKKGKLALKKPAVKPKTKAVPKKKPSKGKATVKLGALKKMSFKPTCKKVKVKGRKLMKCFWN